MERYEKIYKYDQLNPLAFASAVAPSGYRYYCLSDEFARYARQFLGRIQGNPYHFYSNTLPGDRYITPSRQDFDVVQANIAEGLGELMNGCDITEQLQCICDAINNQTATQLANNTGSANAGPVSPAPSAGYDDGVDVPEGFPDYPTFSQHKCDVAHQIFSDVANDIQTAAQIDGAITAVIMASVFLTPMSGGTLLAFQLFMAGAIALDQFYWADYLQVWEGEEDDLICAMVESTTVEQARSNVSQLIQGSALWNNSLFAVYATTTTFYFFDYASLNRLFDESAVGIPGSDCSACAGTGCKEVVIINGSLVDQGQGFVEVASVLLPDGFHWVALNFNALDADNFCGAEVRITQITTLAGNPVGKPDDLYLTKDQGDVTVHNTDDASSIYGDKIAFIRVQSRPAYGGGSYTMRFEYNP